MKDFKHVKASQLKMMSAKERAEYEKYKKRMKIIKEAYIEKQRDKMMESGDLYFIEAYMSMANAMFTYAIEYFRKGVKMQQAHHLTNHCEKEFEILEKAFDTFTDKYIKNTNGITNEDWAQKWDMSQRWFDTLFDGWRDSHVLAMKLNYFVNYYGSASFVTKEVGDYQIEIFTDGTTYGYVAYNQPSDTVGFEGKGFASEEQCLIAAANRIPMHVKELKEKDNE